MILIAASNARQATKDRADLVCTGRDDQKQIEAAMDLLSATGGIIRLSEGAFNLSAGLVLDTVPIQLMGEGRKVTVLNGEYAAAANGVEVANMGRYHTLADFSLVNAGNMENGLVMHGAHNYLARLEIEGALSAGIRGESGNCINLYEQIHALNCGEYGFKFYGVANRSMACIASRSSALGVGGIAGFRFQDSGSSHYGCISEKFSVGLEVTNYAQGLTVDGAHVEACNRALAISGAEGMEPKGINVSLLAFGCLDPELAAIYIGRSLGVSVKAALWGIASGQDAEVTKDAVDSMVSITRLDADAEPAPEPDRPPTRRPGPLGACSSIPSRGGCLIGVDRG